MTVKGDDKKTKQDITKKNQSEQIIKSADSTLVRIKNMSAKLDSIMAEMDKQNK